MLAGCYDVGTECVCGVILGTGSNCCYYESFENMKAYEGVKRGDGMIINLECGNFGSRVDRFGKDLPMTEFDVEVDKDYSNGHQMLEKQISGKYLGEIVRRIIKKYLDQGLIFQDSGNKFSIQDEFPTDKLSKIESDNTATLTETEHLLKALGITNSTHDDRRFLQQVQHLVARRAAQLAAVQIAAILEKIGKSKAKVVAAVDGSVYEKYPGFHDIMQETLHTLGCEHVELKLVKEGSSYGAALASFCSH